MSDVLREAVLIAATLTMGLMAGAAVLYVVGGLTVALCGAGTAPLAVAGALTTAAHALGIVANDPPEPDIIGYGH
jgi:hypothetical protein